jgi:uncharacterized membrane protein
MHPSFDLPVIEIVFVSGIIFLAIGTYLYVLPPKKINNFYGYRTITSMKSQERWDFAQKYSAIKMIQGSAFLLLVSTLSLLVTLSKNQQFYIGISALVIYVITLIYLTEKALRKQFPNP